MKRNLLNLDMENQLQPTVRPGRKSKDVTIDAAAERAARIKFFGLDKMFHPTRQK